MWYDYFCVPQPNADPERDKSFQDGGLLVDLERAIASLSCYVACCDHFMVLAPTIMHEDVAVAKYVSP